MVKHGTVYIGGNLVGTWWEPGGNHSCTLVGTWWEPFVYIGGNLVGTICVHVYMYVAISVQCFTHTVMFCFQP